MHKALAITFAPLFGIAISLTSCVKPSEKIQSATGQVAYTNNQNIIAQYNEAKTLEARGRSKKAAKIYGQIADKYVLSEVAPDARIRQADILYANGKLMQSFEKYQSFITNYSGTSQYQRAIKRQAEIVHAASAGKIQNNFLGLKSDIPRDKVARMFKQVSENAPFSEIAAKAQLGLAEMWQRVNQPIKAINAYEDLYVQYPSSSLAAESLYRVGKILLKVTKDGNYNRRNLDSAQTTFTDLISLYPNSKQAKNARTILKEIEIADIQRSYQIAEFYRKKEQYTSAEFYYNEVIRTSKAESELNVKAKQMLKNISNSNDS